MKRIGLIILIIAATVYLFGCGKKEQTLEEMQEPMSMDTLSAVQTAPQAASEMKAVEVKPQIVTATGEAKARLEALPVTISAKPTTEEIQKALKNSGFYTGNVDGKSGPMTKKAIQAFQQANGLKADGKVGPKTWEVLVKYLESAVTAPTKKR